VRTVDAEATSPKDYIAIDQVIEFKSGRFAKNEAEVNVKIIDDEQWEPDEDFFVELYDINTGKRLVGEDTRTRVTIMDDDRPGMLAFAEKKQLKHAADQDKCRIVIQRSHGADGDISVQYETYELDQTDRTATPGKDYEHVAGTLHFKHREVEQEIVVPILPREDLDGTDVKRDEVFGVKIFNA
jgi:solute carrier family 8 (sodium/calcium exchanger)